MTHIGIDTGGGLRPAVEQLLEGATRRSVRLPRRERRAEALVGLAFAAAEAALFALAPPGDVPLAPLALLVLAYAAASRVSFDVGAGYTVPTQVVFVPMLVLLPPAVVPLAVAAGIALGNLPDYARGTKHPDRAVLVLGDCWHAIGPAAVLAIAGSPEPAWSSWPVYVAAVLAQFVFDFVATTVREWGALGVAPALQPRLLAWVYVVDAALTPVGLLAALAVPGRAWPVLLVLPVVALLSMFARERQARLEHALELNHAYRGTAQLLGDLLEADDAYTGEHSRDVVDLAVSVSRELDLDDRRQRLVEFAALLHDIGKIAVPKEIINKPGPLSEEEWQVIRRHTVEGQRLLDRVGGALAPVGVVVRASHERWDGRGYPDGLRGEEIPLEAAIVSCCDAYHAIVSDRSYRRGAPPAAALAELRANAGTQFHPDVVAALERAVGGRFTRA
jgi:hypothetical protein